MTTVDNEHIGPKPANSNKVAISIAILSAVVSIGISVGSGVWTYHLNMVTQSRQAKIDRVDKFTANAGLVDAAAAYISAMNAARDLAAAREKFSSAIGQQIVATNDLRTAMSPKAVDLTKRYQTALLELGGLTQKIDQPTEMRPWAESFGRALDARSALAEQLKADLTPS
jgi:hypothetical protein